MTGKSIHFSRLKKMKIDLFAKLAAEENAFRESQFLSPVVAGQKVRVRIAGIVLSLKVIEPQRFEGWGVFRPQSAREAIWVRQPSLSERQSYLELFPKVRLVLAFRSRRQWFGVPATHANARANASVGIQDVQPVQLSENCEIFDTVVARSDGQNQWFEKRDPRRSTQVARQLRKHLNDFVDPKTIEVATSTPAERMAYQLAWCQKIARTDFFSAKTDEARIRRALERAGATFRSYREVGDSFRVEYLVDGETHQSTVDQQTLAVQAAGICLSGEDTKFDLQSLVGVIAEGQRAGMIFQF